MSKFILAFAMNNELVEQVGNNYLLKGECWNREDIEITNNVSVLVGKDLYLEIYDKYNKLEGFLEMAHFRTNVEELLEEGSYVEVEGGALWAITVEGSYLNFGAIVCKPINELI